MTYNHILISRTDSIGDVILTLPLAGLLRMRFPEAKISFLGMPYTRSIIESCTNIDLFIDWQQIKEQTEEDSIKQIRTLGFDIILHVFPRKEIARLAYKAGIPKRLGTTGRIYNWLYCNNLVPISRRNSNLHESILNLKLTRRVHGFIIDEKPVPLNEILIDYKTVDTDKSGGSIKIGIAPELFINTSNNNSISISIDNIPALYGFVTKPIKDITFGGLLNPDELNIIIHPRSKGSAREWGLNNYANLSRQLMSKIMLSTSHKVRVFITGTSEEGKMLHNEGFFEIAGNVTDVTGKFSLNQFNQFIQCSDVLIAGSTGPLHIASALGKIAIGLFPPIRPMHPGRWAPIGIRAGYLVAEKECSKCRKSGPCECMQLITVEQVQQYLESMVLKYTFKTKWNEVNR